MNERSKKIRRSTRRTRDMRAAISDALFARRDLIGDFAAVQSTLVSILTDAVMREVRRDKRTRRAA